MWQFFLEFVSNAIFSRKCLSTLFLRFFGKSQKKFKFEKVRKYHEETEHFEKKRLHPSKRHL